MKGMGESLKNGMVLVMSLWDDHAANMLWLDSVYPPGSSKPGAARGTCGPDSGKPEDVEKNSPNSSVKFSNIKVGDIGTTFKPSPGPGPGPSPSGCPGGSLSACIKLCPSDPPAGF
jgi:cellulose 1,4-beta-cellobiosidase